MQVSYDTKYRFQETPVLIIYTKQHVKIDNSQYILYNIERNSLRLRNKYVYTTDSTSGVVRND